MSKCSNCNFELNDSLFCPMCGAKAEETAKTEVLEETPMETQPEIGQSVIPPQENEMPVIQPQEVPAQPSAFSRTIKQAFNCFKYFFSKNAVEAISVQHKERLNIWIILFAIPALLSAISCCIHGGSVATDLLDMICVPFALGSNRFAWFVSGLLLTSALVFSCTVLTFLYSKVIKKNLISFIGSANLIATSFIPMTLVFALSVVIGANTGVLNIVAFLMFTFLWKKGMDNVHGEDNKNYWVFFVLVAVVLATYALISCVVSAPGWIYDAVNKYTVSSGLQGMLDPYSW